MRQLVRAFCGALLATAAVVTLADTSTEVDQYPEPQSFLHAAPAPTGGAFTDADDARLWILELPTNPKGDGSDAATLSAEQEAARQKLRDGGILFEERYAYQRLLNALSLALRPQDTRAAEELTGGTVYPVTTIDPPSPSPVLEPELDRSLAKIGADVVRTEMGLTGRNVRVGIIDTGVDYHHPDLGGCFGPGCRVETGWDFVGDTLSCPTCVHPDPDPDDCVGHGTHVAGIVGASAASENGATGVAPGVTFGAYRVFACSNPTTTDILVKALERADEDHMQVVNLSLGSPLVFPQEPANRAFDRLVNKGVVVVASAGNRSDLGLFGVSSPGAAQKVISVASADNTAGTRFVFSASPDDREFPYRDTLGNPPLNGTYPLVTTDLPEIFDGCFPLRKRIDGSIALVRWGGCNPIVKEGNVRTAGGSGMILYNSGPGFGGIKYPDFVRPTIPVFFVAGEDGAILKSRVAAGEVGVTFAHRVEYIPSQELSYFSSMGPAMDLSFKPDITAPGGGVHSTFPLERGGYTTLWGTSMAAPHVTGAVALLLEAAPHTSPQAVVSVLQNGAMPLMQDGAPVSIPRQGAGMLRIDNVLRASVRALPGKLSLGEGDGPITHAVTLANLRDEPMDVTLSHEAGPSAVRQSWTFYPIFLPQYASAQFSSDRVSIPAKSKITVHVAITPDATLPFSSVYGGWLVVTPSAGPVTRVPYVGFKGDYQAVPVLADPKPVLISRQFLGDYLPAQPGTVYPMFNPIFMPWMLFHLDNGVKELRIEAVNLDTGATHKFLQLKYVSRNEFPGEPYGTRWDGTFKLGNKTVVAPNGPYLLRFWVLKALGDPTNPQDWESADTTWFVIRRQ